MPKDPSDHDMNKMELKIRIYYTEEPCFLVSFTMTKDSSDLIEIGIPKMVPFFVPMKKYKLVPPM